MAQKNFLTFFQRQKSGWFSKLGSFAGRKSFWNLPILRVQKFARLKILKTSIFFGWKSFKKPSVYAALWGIDTLKILQYNSPTVKGWNTFFSAKVWKYKMHFWGRCYGPFFSVKRTISYLRIIHPYRWNIIFQRYGFLFPLNL